MAVWVVVRPDVCGGKCDQGLWRSELSTQMPTAPRPPVACPPVRWTFLESLRLDAPDAMFLVTSPKMGNSFFNMLFVIYSILGEQVNASLLVDWSECYSFEGTSVYGWSPYPNGQPI